MPAPLERCSRCQRSISQYEMPRIWHDTIVCPECYTLLAEAVQQKAPKVSPLMVAAAPQKSPTPAPAPPSSRRRVAQSPDAYIAAQPVEPIQGAAPMAFFDTGIVEPIEAAAHGPPSAVTDDIPAKAARAVLAVGVLHTTLGSIIAAPMFLLMLAAMFSSSGSAAAAVGMLVMFVISASAAALGVWSIILARKIRADQRNPAITALVIAGAGAVAHFIYLVATLLGWIVSLDHPRADLEAASSSDHFGASIIPLLLAIVSVIALILLGIAITHLARLLQRGALAGTYRPPSGAAPQTYSPPESSFAAAPQTAFTPEYQSAYRPAGQPMATLISGTRKLTGRLMMAAGIATLSLGGLILGLGFVILLAVLAHPGHLHLFSWMIFVWAFLQIAIGLAMLVARPATLRKNPVATYVVLAAAYLQITLCAMGMFNVVHAAVTGPNHVLAGSAGDAQILTGVIALTVDFILLLGFFAVLTPLLICLHRLLMEGRRATARRTGGKPVLPATLIGGSIGAGVGILITILCAVLWRWATVKTGLYIIAPATLLGLGAGYFLALQQRAAAGIMHPAQHWRVVFASGRASVIAAAGIVCALLLAMLTSFSLNAYFASAGGQALADESPGHIHVDRHRVPRRGEIDPMPPEAMGQPAPAVPTPVGPPPGGAAAFVAFWQPAGEATDILGDMQNAPIPDADHWLTLTRRTTIKSGTSYTVPSTFRIILRTHQGDTRLGFSARQVIFNWEMHKSELRIDGGPANGRHKAGAGDLPDNQWTTIEWITLPNEMRIYVDGKLRYQANADFSRVKAPFSIFTTGDTPLTILSITRVQPR